MVTEHHYARGGMSRLAVLLVKEAGVECLEGALKDPLNGVKMRSGILSVSWTKTMLRQSAHSVDVLLFQALVCSAMCDTGWLSQTSRPAYAPSTSDDRTEPFSDLVRLRVRIQC